MENPILVYQHFVSPVFTHGERYKEWVKVCFPCKHVIITKRQAMELIDEYGLVSVIKNEYGEVFDTPDKEFRRRWIERKSMK